MTPCRLIDKQENGKNAVMLIDNENEKIAEIRMKWNQKFECKALKWDLLVEVTDPKYAESNGKVNL